MSEEDQSTLEAVRAENGLEPEADTNEAVIEDFDQNGLLLKIAVNGITVQDYCLLYTSDAADE